MTKASCLLQNSCHGIVTELVAFLSCGIHKSIGHLVQCGLLVCPRVSLLVLRSWAPWAFGCLPSWLCSCAASECSRSSAAANLHQCLIPAQCYELSWRSS